MLKVKEIVSKRAIKEIEEKEIIGYTRLKRYKEDKQKSVEEMIYCDKSYEVKDKIKGLVYKYAYIGDNKYVGIKIPLWYLILITLLCIILITGCMYLSTRVVQKEGTDIVYETEREVNKKQETIEFPGIDSRYVITEERKTIRLINPKNNTVYFRYSIYKGKDKIHKTKYIEPNKMVEVDLWNILERGEYNIIVSVDTRDIETNKQTTSVNFETVIEVVK